MNSTSFTIDKRKNILVIGDSHAECSIDDSVFGRAANYSKSGTAFVYSFAALRKLIADNTQIDTVLLSFHTGSLLYERERTWIFNDVEISRQVPVLFPYFNNNDVRLFLSEPQFYRSVMAIPRVAINYFFKKVKGKGQIWVDENIGNSRRISWSNFEKDTSIAKPYGSLERRDSISLLAVKYIRKISVYCRENHITLILFNAPVYHWKKYVNYIEFEENRKKYLKDILFLDYAQFPLADSCRFDIWHLNANGAREFSKYLERNLVSDIKRQNP